MKKIAIIGGGPAGIMAAIVAKEATPSLLVTIFEKTVPLKTILATGGGRCNLSYADFDFKSFASNYPRGEKFLYSVFSAFGVKETLDWFKRHGVKTYSQPDNRIFPVTDSANDVRNCLLKVVAGLGIKIERNTNICGLEHSDGIFSVKTVSGEEKFDNVIIASGGRYKKQECTGFRLAEGLGHKISELKPALCGLKLEEAWIKNLAGISLREIEAVVSFKNEKSVRLIGDLLFTHEGISGPLTYKISSYCAFYDYGKENPLKINLNLVKKSSAVLEEELIEKFDKLSKKSLGNILCDYLSKTLISELLQAFNLDFDKKASQVSKNERKLIVSLFTSFELSAIWPSSSGEIVTAGGVLLKEINSKTMESKLVKGLYFCGEVLNIDGLTGGFNLQACWSTGYIAGQACSKL